MNLRMHFEEYSKITSGPQEHGIVSIRIEESRGVFAQISMRADHVQAFYAQLSDALTPHLHEAALHQIEKPLAKAAPRDEPLRDPRVDPQPGDEVGPRIVTGRTETSVDYRGRYTNRDYRISLLDWRCDHRVS